MTQKRPSREGLLYRWHCKAHVAMLYGKMTGKPFTIAELREFSDNIDRKTVFRLVNAMAKAEARGHVVKLGDQCWQVTPAGVNYLMYMASYQRKYHPLPEDEQAELDDEVNFINQIAQGVAA